MKRLLNAESVLDFWHPIPHAVDGLNNKRGAARFVYLTLLHYFFYYKCFPDLTTFPERSEELIKQGITYLAPTVTIDAVIQFLKNKHQVYRYKKEIRTNFGYRLFTPEDLVKIEARMREIVDRNEPITREVWDRNEAIKFFKDMGEHFKAEIISDLPENETITLYRQGDRKSVV